MTAGPATGAASLSTKKMPVPIVAPMPNVDSWNSPIERESSPPSLSAPVSAAMTLTGLRRVTCSRSDAIAPVFPSLDVAREQVRPCLAPDHQPGRTAGREDDRDAAVAVVVVGHREAVGAGRRHGEQVADPRLVEGHVLDQDVAALAV